jgi:hypothetical protein
MVPTLCASRTGAADGAGVGVGVGDADGEGVAVAAGAFAWPPHAASTSAEHAATAEIRNKRMEAITADRYTV